jgi:predicted acyltransferase
MRSDRIVSLDVFRGLTIALMILVNATGAGAAPYTVLAHSAWFGFTLADLVFPSFLFAMGNALAFVLSRPMTDRQFRKKIFERVVLLFLIGFLMYWYPFVHFTAEGTLAINPLADTRIMGVLQRTALTYGLAALFVRRCSVKQIVLIGLGLLIGYWGLLLWGAPEGFAFSKSANLGSRIDVLILGQSHLLTWDNGFEPEGLLGTLPATVNVLAGYLAGRLLQQAPDRCRAALLAAACGLALAAAGLIWSQWFPLSKKLWTGSFVLLTVGIDLIVLAALVLTFDVKKVVAGREFFSVFGMNPLALYLFSELLPPSAALLSPVLGGDPSYWIGVTIYQNLAPGPFGALLCAASYMLLCWVVGYGLYRRNLFVRL